VLLAAIHAALADGGRLQMRTDAGPFTVSVFTIPDSLTAGPADLSVLVQDAASGDVLMDAAVTLTLTDPSGAPLVLHPSHAQATNQLLQAAQVNLKAPGKWRVRVEVVHGTQSAACATDLEVAGRSSQWGTIWFFALLPLGVLGVFVGVQVRKARMLRDRYAAGARSSSHDLRAPGAV
jgi:hypothetical protein